jgi:hypothetical protein
LRRALLTGQMASTLQPTLAKDIARRAVVNHLEVVAIRIVGVTGCGAPPGTPRPGAKRLPQARYRVIRNTQTKLSSPRWNDRAHKYRDCFGLRVL